MSRAVLLPRQALQQRAEIPARWDWDEHQKGEVDVVLGVPELRAVPCQGLAADLERQSDE